MEGNHLEWQTSSELNNKGFSIESSLNAMKFNQIGFVKGNGTANATNGYSFTESAPANITYYRLKQIDFDSTSHYSKVIMVKKGTGNLQSEAISVFPNPSTGQLFVKTKKDLGYSIQTLNGKTIQKGTAVAGKPIETSSLQNGLYLFSIEGEVIKVVVNH